MREGYAYSLVKHTCTDEKIMECFDNYKKCKGPRQRVLNDLERNRLSCFRMIWLLPHPFSLQQTRTTAATHSKTERLRQLGWGEGDGKEPNHTAIFKLTNPFEQAFHHAIFGVGIE
jgi:hypothetical protein